MNLGIINKTRCVEIVNQINESFKLPVTKHLMNVLDAVRLLPEGRRNIKSIHSFAHRNENIELTELAVMFWEHTGEVTEHDGQWGWAGKNLHSSKQLAENFVRRSDCLKRFFSEGKVVFATVADERKKLERTLMFSKEASALKDIAESLRNRNLKEAAFLYMELNDTSKDNLHESLDTFLSYLYDKHYASVLMNEEYQIGESKVNTLTEEEKKTLVNTLNIFLANNQEFNKANIHEASNIGVQMAICKAEESAPDKIKEQLQSLKEKLTEDIGIANAIGTGSDIAGMKANDPVVAKPKKKKDEREKFAGRHIFKVSEEDYGKCMPGKVKYERWNKIFDEDSEVGMEIKNYARKNPTTPFIVQNEKSGEMMYFTRHENPKRGKKE